MIPRIFRARAMREASLRPYTSATKVCKTGGPGGTSATATAAPYFAAMAVTRGRMRLAMAWL